MKKTIHQTIKAVLITVLFSFSVTSLRAQGWGMIDSLKLIPDSPNETSTVQVACFATFGSGDCFIVDTSVTISGTTITVQAYHMIGMLTVICNSADTISLGSNFSPGNYTVVYNLNDSGLVAIDTDTLYFTIPQAQGIAGIDTQPNINIYPTPATNELNVQFRNSVRANNIAVVDVLGRVIYSDSDDSKSVTINLESLLSGVYFIKLQMQNGNVEVKRFVKE